MEKKIDILFVSPHSENAFGVVQAAHRPEFNLGVGYLVSYCLQKGFAADCVDMGAEGVSVTDLCTLIGERKPSVVGITVVTLTMDVSIKIAKAIKQLNEDILIIAGGPHPTALPERTLEEGPFDVIVRGEGEATSLEAVQAIESRTSDCAYIVRDCHHSLGLLTLITKKNAFNHDFVLKCHVQS